MALKSQHTPTISIDNKLNTGHNIGRLIEEFSVQTAKSVFGSCLKPLLYTRMLYKQAQRDIHQFKICCCDFDFDLIKIGWIFTDIWRYNDFQNGGRRYLGIVLPPYETTHVVSVAGRSCLSNYFHVNLIRVSEDEFFAYLAWNAYWGPKMGVFGDVGPLNVIIHHRDPQKAHSCVNPRLLSYHQL